MKKNHTLFEKIEDFTQKHQLINSGNHILVGLSGGPDSVFLLYFFKHIAIKYQLKITAAHLDHQWQDQSADMAQFCLSLAQALHIPIIIKKAQELDKVFKKTGSQEELGRNMRRYFFQKIKAELHAHSIALAHQAQDQQETFFIRLIRGTTLDGLCGMYAREGNYIRPLLQTNKEDIVHWLHQENISFITDPTNISEKFLRNRIRMQVIPALNQCDDRFNENFLRTLGNLQKTHDFLDSLTQKKFNDIALIDQGGVKINLEKFQQLSEFLQDRMLVYWLIKEGVTFQLTEDFLQEIKRFIFQGKKDSHTLHETWAIKKKNNFAWIEIH